MLHDWGGCIDTLPTLPHRPFDLGVRGAISPLACIDGRLRTVFPYILHTVRSVYGPGRVGSSGVCTGPLKLNVRAIHDDPELARAVLEKRGDTSTASLVCAQVRCRAASLSGL